MDNKELIRRFVSFDDDGTDTSTGYVDVGSDFDIEGALNEIEDEEIFIPGPGEDYVLGDDNERNITVGLSHNWEFDLIINCDILAEKSWLYKIGSITFVPYDGDWDSWNENEPRALASFYLKGKPENIEKVMSHIGGDFQNVNLNVLGNRIPHIQVNYINEVWEPQIRILSRLRGDKTFTIGSGNPRQSLEISNSLVIVAPSGASRTNTSRPVLSSVTVELEPDVSFRENTSETTLSLDFGDYDVKQLNIITNGVEFSWLEIPRGFTPRDVTVDDYSNVSGFRWYPSGGYSAPVELSRHDPYNKELLTDDVKWEETAKKWLDNFCHGGKPWYQQR